MNPLDEKASTLSRCGSFYYRTLVDESKADAEFVSHLSSYTRLTSLGEKIATAVQGGCYYNDLYKLIKFTDTDVDWNGVKQALQQRISGGAGVVTEKMEQISISSARELGTQAWELSADDVPAGVKQVTKVKMQVINTAPVTDPLYLQVFHATPDAATPILLAASTNTVELEAGNYATWDFSLLLLGTEFLNNGGNLMFQFATVADAAWQSNAAIPYSRTVGVGAYVPSVQFWRNAAPEQSLPAYNRAACLTIKDHLFVTDDKWNWISREGTPQPVAFPGANGDIILSDSQELIWDLHIDRDIMVTSIQMEDGTILYANQDFASQFGKLTFLQNPIAMFPKMQFMARSYTGRMPNLYNYLVHADSVYGSISRMLRYARGSQSIKSLYYASAQAAGLAVVDQDCTIVAVSPLLDGKSYITTAGRYDAAYPHTPLKPGVKLAKNYIIGGNQLYRLIGPYDPMPSNITGIKLGTALPVPGLVAPNKDIVIRSAFKPYAPEYEGDPSAIAAYHAYIESMTPAITTVNVEEGVTNLTPYISTIPSDSSWQLLLYDKNLSAESMAYTFKFDTYTLTVGYTADLKLYVQGNRTGSAAPNVNLTPESVDLGNGGLKLDSFTTLSLNKEFEHPVWPEIASVSPQQLTVTEKNNFFVESASSSKRTTALLIKLTYDAQLKQLSCQLILLRGFIEVFLIGGVDSVPTAYTPRCFRGAGTVALTTYLPNWEINNIQSVHTEAASLISVSSMVGKISDTAYPEIQDPQNSKPEYMENGINHFRYIACPNRCVVACINESYMTAQMKLRLMTYLQRELPIGSVLTTANLPNIINETPELTSKDIMDNFNILPFLHLDDSHYVKTNLVFDTPYSYDIEVKAYYGQFAPRYANVLGGVNVPTDGVEGYTPARCIGGASTYGFTYNKNYQLLITRPADAVEAANELVYRMTQRTDDITIIEIGDKTFNLGDGTLQLVDAASSYLPDKGGVPEDKTYWIGMLHSAEGVSGFRSNAYHLYWKFTDPVTNELALDLVPVEHKLTKQQGFMDMLSKTFYPSVSITED